MDQIDKEYLSVVKRQASSSKRVLAAIDTVLQRLRETLPPPPSVSSTASVTETLSIPSLKDKMVIIPNLLGTIKDDHKIVHAAISKLSKAIENNIKSSNNLEDLTIVSCFQSEEQKRGLHLAIIDYYIRKGEIDLAIRLSSIFRLPLPSVRRTPDFGSTLSFPELLLGIRKRNQQDDSSSSSSLSTPVATVPQSIPLTTIFASLNTILTALKEGNIFPMLVWITEHTNQLETLFTSIPVPESLRSLSTDPLQRYPLSLYPTVQEWILTLRMIHIQQIILGRLYLSTDESQSLRYPVGNMEDIRVPSEEDRSITESSLPFPRPNVCVPVPSENSNRTGGSSCSSTAVSVALAYAREHLLPFLMNPSSSVHLKQCIQKLIGSFIYVTDEKNDDNNTGKVIVHNIGHDRSNVPDHNSQGNPSVARTVKTDPKMEETINQNKTIHPKLPPYNTVTYNRLQRSPYAYLYPSESIKSSVLSSGGETTTTTIEMINMHPLPDLFRFYYCVYYGISSISPFERLILTVQQQYIGDRVVPQLFKYVKMCKDTGGMYPFTGSSSTRLSNIRTVGTPERYDEILPIEGIPVYHTVFACPVTRQACSLTMSHGCVIRLSCGHVISRQSLDTLNRGGRFKCPTCPTFSTSSQTITLRLK